MRTLFFILLAIGLVNVEAGEPTERVVIYLLDPRLVTTSQETLPIEWNDTSTDVIATRKLNISEGRQLKELLNKDLADDDNVPFCGHSPAYAVSVFQAGKPATTVTLCGTCKTWAKAGELRALHGTTSLEYLDKLLPLPAVFRADAENGITPGDPFEEGNAVPFIMLDSVTANQRRLQSPP